MYSTSDFRRGLRILYQNIPYEITEFQNHNPGKGASIVRTRLRNLITGLTIDPTFRSGDKVEQPDLDERDTQFLYAGDDVYHFMDPVSFEQFEVPASTLGDTAHFLVDGLPTKLLFFQGKAITAEVPNHVVLEVTECDPAVRGDTVSGATKPATFNTGHSCHVPLFINMGDKIRVDTRTGDYIERA